MWNSTNNNKKITRRSSVVVTNEQYEFLLPAHKADRFFEGNKIIVKKDQYCNINPLSAFQAYLTSCDNRFPLSSPLWILENGAVPTRQIFITCLRHFFKCDIAGQSMRAGGATSLAEHGVTPALIQFMGRWSSDAFFIYIRKNPVLIQALLHSGRSTWLISLLPSSPFLFSLHFYPFSSKKKKKTLFFFLSLISSHHSSSQKKKKNLVYSCTYSR